jgi:hypothetical protein
MPAARKTSATTFSRTRDGSPKPLDIDSSLKPWKRWLRISGRSSSKRSKLRRKGSLWLPCLHALDRLELPFRRKPTSFHRFPPKCTSTATYDGSMEGKPPPPPPGPPPGPVPAAPKSKPQSVTMFARTADHSAAVMTTSMRFRESCGKTVA